jgi:hypothetical protein
MKHFDEAQHEGGLLAAYCGRGTVTLHDGSANPCDFEIEHHAEIGVLVACEFQDVIPAGSSGVFRSFVGVTNDGLFRVQSVGQASYRSAQYNVGDEGSRASFLWHLQGVELERQDKPRYSLARYGVTNFEFHGTDAASGFENLDLTLKESGQAVEVVVEPHRHYKSITRFLSSYRSVRVTGEICLNLAGRELDEKIDGIVGRLCHVLSVARGTRIVWVYRYAYDSEGRLAAMYHFSAWVGRYSSLSVFDDGAAHMQDVKRFIETAYVVFCDRKDVFELGSNLIESYLAAKAEGDLLERRGVKLAVALEVLRHLFLRQAHCPVQEFILPGPRFEKIAEKSLRPAFREVLGEKQVDEGDIRAICEKLRELNRTSFAVVLRSLFDSVGFSPAEAETRLFLRERNTLVHTGHFYRYKAEDRSVVFFTHDDASADIDEDDSAWKKAGYFFMINFMDRLFLRFFGYTGKYLNRKIHSLKDRHVGNYDTLD